MDRADFKTYLIAASYWSVQLARPYMKNTLPYEFTYDVELNQSMDTGAGEEFVVYPEDDGKIYLQQSVDNVVALLVRDGKVPVWIDIIVISATQETTSLQLLCAGRFTNQREHMYYARRGHGPFGIKSPKLSSLWSRQHEFSHTTY